MNEIIAKLQDPSWWFTGVFFIFVGLIISAVVKRAPKLIKKLNRNLKARRLRKIKSIRWNPYRVIYQITLDNTYFLIFILACFFYLGLLLATPLSSIFKQSFTSGVILVLPLYILEILWLFKKSFVTELLSRQAKLQKSLSIENN